MLCLFGVAGSYARMALKVSNYNSLQHETELLRHRYDNLQKQVQQTNQQLASLQVLATEVSTAYGIRNQIAGSPDLIGEAPLIPTDGRYARRIQLSPHHQFHPPRPDDFLARRCQRLSRRLAGDGPLMAGFGERTRSVLG